MRMWQKRLIGICVVATSLTGSRAGRTEQARLGSVVEADRPADLPGSIGEVLSPSRALDLFRQGNLALVAARHDLEAARADIIAAGVLPNPTLSLNGTFLTHGWPQGGRQSYVIAYDQVLPVAGQVGLRKDVARGHASAAERDFVATAWSLGCDVRENYLDLQVAQSRWRVSKAGIADLRRVEGIIAQRAAAGANPDYDRLRVVVELNNLSGRLAEATSELSTARAELAQSIGRNVDARHLVVEDEIPESPDPPTNFDEIVARALAQRPEVSAAHLRVDAAGYRITQTRREYYPSPDVQVGFNYWTNLPQNDTYLTGSAIIVGIGIPLPVFDHGQGRVDRAAAEQLALRARSEAVEVSVRREAVRGAQAMQARVEAWRNYRDTTAGQVERLRSIAESAYREGKSGILELLDAYRAYLESKERALDLRASAWRTTLALQRALGPSPDQ